jgi:6-phosphogluconate dehydrogenase
MILDKADDKGNRHLTLQAAIKQSVVISTINAAVGFARYLCAEKQEARGRVQDSATIESSKIRKGNRPRFVDVMTLFTHRKLFLYTRGMELCA